MQMKDFILVIVCLLSLNIILTGCIILHPDGDTIIGENEKDITFRWNIVNSKQFHNMEFFHNNIDRTKALAAATIRFNQDVVLVSSNPRLTSGSCYFPNNNGTCNFTLSNLRYEDSGLYYAVEFSGSQKVTEKSVTLNVTGGPNLCGSERLPQNFTCNPGQTITGNVTLCGKPKPIVTWYLKHKSIPGEPVNESLKDQHQYTYSFQLKTDSNMCGQNISYKAAGIYNIARTSTILLENSNVSDVAFIQTGGCPELTWNAGEHELCEVDIVLSFVQNDKTTLNVTVPVSSERFNNCNYTENSTGLTYQTIVYWKNNGRKIQTSINKTSEYLVLEKTTTTTSTTTTITTTTTSTTKTTPTTASQTTSTTPNTNSTTPNTTNTSGQNKGSCTQDTAAIAGTFIGGVASGIVSAAIVYIIWLRKGKTEENSNFNELKVRKNEHAADEVMPTNSNIVSNNGTDAYSTLTTPFDVKGSTYTDLVKEPNLYEVHETVLRKPPQSNRDYEVM